MTFISVIVPIYNTENELEECLVSIKKQTFRDFEVLMINDGSTDGSESICVKFAQEDSRFKYFYQTNAGLSAARNAGLNHSTGNFISFVDSDDYISPNTFAECVKLLSKNQADIVIFGWNKVIGDTTVRSHFVDKQKVYNSEEAIDRLLRYSSFDNFMCNKIFKASLFQSRRFVDGVLLEDVYMMYQTLADAQVIVSTSEPYYQYRMREGSLTSRMSNQVSYDSFEAYETRRRDLLKLFPELRRIIEANFFMAARHFYLTSIASQRRDSSHELKYLKIMRRRFSYMLFDASIPIQTKIGSLITAIAPWIYIRKALNGKK